jgi:hypothetical protein
VKLGGLAFLLRFGAEWDEEYSNSFNAEELVTEA